MTGTGNALATRNSDVSAYQQAALAISPGQDRWEAAQLAALAQLGLKDASEGDRAVFLHVCQRTGLDPFSRQIYMINRREKVPGTRDQWRDKWTIQTGIDGFRVNRSRAEKEAGVRGILGRAVFYDPEGNEFKVWTRREPPVACEITYTVRDGNGETPYTSVLRFNEYVQLRDDNGVKVPSGQWATKPAHMLEKCTEADVYRKAFPQDFSGFQLDDAMPAPDPDAPPVQPERQRVTAEQARARKPQQVKSEVVDAEVVDEAPWPGGAAPRADTATGEVIPEDPTTSGASSSAHAPGSASPARTGEPSPSSASGSVTTPSHAKTDADPRDTVISHLDRLLVTGPEIAKYLTRLAGKPLASVESLTRAQAEWFTAKLAKLDSHDELEAAAVAAEARREAGDA